MAVVFVVRFLLWLWWWTCSWTWMWTCYLTLLPGQLNSNSVVHEKLFKLFKLLLIVYDQTVVRQHEPLENI